MQANNSDSLLGVLSSLIAKIEVFLQPQRLASAISNHLAIACLIFTVYNYLPTGLVGIH